jgi:hypothetical protein
MCVMSTTTVLSKYMASPMPNSNQDLIQEKSSFQPTASMSSFSNLPTSSNEINHPSAQTVKVKKTKGSKGRGLKGRKKAKLLAQMQTNAPNMSGNTDRYFTQSKNGKKLKSGSGNNAQQHGSQQTSLSPTKTIGSQDKISKQYNTQGLATISISKTSDSQNSSSSMLTSNKSNSKSRPSQIQTDIPRPDQPSNISHNTMSTKPSGQIQSLTESKSNKTSYEPRPTQSSVSVTSKTFSAPVDNPYPDSTSIEITAGEQKEQKVKASDLNSQISWEITSLLKNAGLSRSTTFNSATKSSSSTENRPSQNQTQRLTNVITESSFSSTRTQSSSQYQTQTPKSSSNISSQTVSSSVTSVSKVTPSTIGTTTGPKSYQSHSLTTSSSRSSQISSAPISSAKITSTSNSFSTPLNDPYSGSTSIEISNGDKITANDLNNQISGEINSLLENVGLRSSSSISSATNANPSTLGQSSQNMTQESATSSITASSTRAQSSVYPTKATNTGSGIISQAVSSSATSLSIVSSNSIGTTTGPKYSQSQTITTSSSRSSQISSAPISSAKITSTSNSFSTSFNDPYSGSTSIEISNGDKIKANDLNNQISGDINSLLENVGLRSSSSISSATNANPSTLGQSSQNMTQASATSSITASSTRAQSSVYSTKATNTGSGIISQAVSSSATSVSIVSSNSIGTTTGPKYSQSQTITTSSSRSSQISSAPISSAKITSTSNSFSTPLNDPYSGSTSIEISNGDKITANDLNSQISGEINSLLENVGLRSSSSISSATNTNPSTLGQSSQNMTQGSATSSNTFSNTTPVSQGQSHSSSTQSSSILTTQNTGSNPSKTMNIPTTTSSSVSSPSLLGTSNGEGSTASNINNMISGQINNLLGNLGFGPAQTNSGSQTQISQTTYNKTSVTPMKYAIKGPSPGSWTNIEVSGETIVNNDNGTYSRSPTVQIEYY